MILATELDEGRKCFRLNRKPVLQVNSSTQVVSSMTLKELCDKAEHTEPSRCLGEVLPKEVVAANTPTMAALQAKVSTELGEVLCMALENDFKLELGRSAKKNEEVFLECWVNAWICKL